MNVTCANLKCNYVGSLESFEFGCPDCSCAYQRDENNRLFSHYLDVFKIKEVSNSDRLRQTYLMDYFPWNPRIKLINKDTKQVLEDDLTIEIINLWLTGGYDYELVLRPISDLTKEIEQKGKKFIPALELFRVMFIGTKSFNSNNLTIEEFERSVYVHDKENLNSFQIFTKEIEYNPHWVVKILMQWHFEVRDESESDYDLYEKLVEEQNELNAQDNEWRIKRKSIYADYFFSTINGWDFSRLEIDSEVWVESHFYRFIPELEEELQRRSIELNSIVKRKIEKDKTIYWLEK